MPRRKKDELPRSGSPDKEIKNLQEQLRIAEQKITALREPTQKYKISAKRGNSYRFAMYSDPHVGSLYANVAALESFYKYAFGQNIRDFYCGGDLLDGHGIYRGQEFELEHVGFDRQVNAFRDITKRFPKGCRTYTIDGNHDTSFSNKIGMSVGKVIEKECIGMTHIGTYSGMVTVETKMGDLRIAMIHPAGGTPYAISYKSQKIIEAWEGGEKPHILGTGHLHKADWLPCHRNVSAFQMGCFQNQTPFMQRMPTPAHVGGWLLEVSLGELVNRVKAEFIRFF